MGKPRWVVPLIALFLCAALAGSKAEDDELPPPDGAKFWTYITKTSPYTGWGALPGLEDIVPGKGPHGAFIRIYANERALNAFKEDKPMPNGAILVKENYDEDKSGMTAITPMYKVKGYHKQGGDWFWANYTPDGKIVQEGKVKECINCHRIRKKQSWLFSKE